MLVASIALGILAVALAWPVPIALGRAHWPARAPAVALVLWQAIALAGGLSIIGALLTYGLIPFGDTLVRSLGNLAHHLVTGEIEPDADMWNLLALCAAVLLGAHLVANLAFTLVSTERQRRRHRNLVELLGSPVPGRPRTTVIDNAAPVAYCLPGTLRSVTVLSDGLIRMLSADELEAVIAHERGHVTQRHDLLLVAFRAWHISLPWFPTAYRAEREVGSLVEMLADDQARRSVDDRTLAVAVALVAGAAPTGGAATAPTVGPSDAVLGWATESSSPRQVGARVTRLVGGAQPLPLAARIIVLVASLALVAVPTVLLFAPVGA